MASRGLSVAERATPSTARRRVLLIAPFAPWPADSGGAQRSLAVARALGAQHDVTLLCALPPLAVGQGEADARRACEAVLADSVREIIWAPSTSVAEPTAETGTRSLLSRVASTVRDQLLNPTPFAFRTDFSSWVALLDGRRAEFDAVVVRCVIMAPVAEGFAPERVVLDADDLNFSVQTHYAARQRGLRRLAGHLEARRSWRYERALFRRVAQVLVSNEDDRARLALPNVSIVANGVRLADQPQVARDDRTVVFVGHCGWIPNADGLRWFLDHVWGEVLSAVPDAHLNIVGRDAHPDTIGPANYTRVSFHADVPEVASWFASATASVVPLLEGSGTRIKIIESLGYATPVVSTPIGAAGLHRDFGVADGLVLATEPHEVAAALIGVLRDGQPARRAALRGAERVRRDWSWDAQTRLLADSLARWTQRL